VVSGVQLLRELGTLLVPLDMLILKRNNLLLEVNDGLSLKLEVEGEDHVWFEDRWMVASLCDE
jgi:hypothetical protein